MSSLNRIAAELEHGRQTIADDIYRKLNVETHKRVENNMDIAPRISGILAVTFLLWIVSRFDCSSHISYYFLADRTNGRAYATVLRPSVVVVVVVCNVMYCG